MELLVTLLAIALGLVPLIGAIIVIAIGVRRLRGHRTRLDPFFESLARTQSAAIYPHSLRGHADDTVAYGVEAQRAADATRHAPAVRRRRRGLTRRQRSAD